MNTPTNIAIVDCSCSGHRQTYYQTFARTLAGQGHTVRLIVPQVDREEAGVHFTPIRTRRLHPLPMEHPLKKKITVLLNAFLQLCNLYTLRKQLRDSVAYEEPDWVFFPCLDDVLPTLTPLWLLNLLLPYPWSGLLLQMPKGGVIDPRRCLRSRHCTGLAVLNELCIPELKRFHSHIVLFPDIADTSAPDTSYPLLKRIQEKAGERKIVSLLGSLHVRKGTKLLLQTIPLLPTSEYYFVLAGKSSLTPSQKSKLSTFEATHSNCLFSLERIPDEACFNALVDASALIFAVYRQFTGSSNLLTKAAAFGKPIIVAKGQCMGQRVEHYRTGATVGETDAPACADAIAQLCQPHTYDESGLTRYAADHSLQRLADCFNRLFYALP